MVKQLIHWFDPSPRSTALEASSLTITPLIEPTIYCTRGELADHYTTDRAHDLLHSRRARWPLHHWLSPRSTALAPSSLTITPLIEPTIYCTWGELADHYTTDRAHDLMHSRRAHWPLHHCSSPWSTALEASSLTITPLIRFLRSWETPLWAICQ